MNVRIKKSALASAMAVAGCALVFPVWASCGVSDLAKQGVFSPAAKTTELRAAQLTRALSAAMQKTATPNPNALQPGRAIVGMWQFQYVSMGNGNLGIPDGVMLDSGFQTWHSDGSEITNSARPPQDGNFCTGVWAYGHGAYRLNHWALGNNLDGTPAGPANIHEDVSVARDGNSFSGTFSIDQYDLAGAVVILHLDGTINATRVTVD